jgi:C-methyltransferase
MTNLPPHLELATMSRWYVVSRAIHVMARLGIADQIDDKPTDVQVIAHKTNTCRQNLERMLNFLSSYQIVNAHGNGFFSLTELSKTLRSDSSNSIKDVVCMVDDAWWEAFAQLEKSIQVGDSAFKHKHKQDFFEFLQSDPARQENFDKGMAKLSEFDDALIAESFDFSSYSSLADLGAGRGGLSQQIAQRHPQLNVVLFDTSAVIKLLDKSIFSKNLKIVEGDFFHQLPDTESYILKGVLHDFNDEQAISILKNCNTHLNKDGHLFIAEQVLPESLDPHPNKTMDIVMLTLLNGRQRTIKQWSELANSAGFKLDEVAETESLFSVLKFSNYPG